MNHKRVSKSKKTRTNYAKYSGNWAILLKEASRCEKNKSGFVRCFKCNYKMLTRNEVYKHIEKKHKSDRVHTINYCSEDINTKPTNQAAVESEMSDPMCDAFEYTLSIPNEDEEDEPEATILVEDLVDSKLAKVYSKI